MLNQLAQWDPDFGMMDIDNIEIVDDSNPRGEAAQKNFTASIESMSVLQQGLNVKPTGESGNTKSVATPHMVTRQAGISQQNDSNFKHPPPDDESVLTYQDHIA